MDSAYNPMEPARSPDGKPLEKPKCRVLVHRNYASAWEQIVERVGLKQARLFWDHVAQSPGTRSNSKHLFPAREGGRSERKRLLEDHSL